MNGRKAFAALVAIVACLNLSAQTFRAEAPDRVVAGNKFQLAYVFTDVGSGDIKEMKMPEVKGFEVLAGPYTAQSQSINYVNGKMTRSQEVKYTYMLLASEVGNYELPPATATVKKNEWKSNALKITVLPADKASAASASNGSTATASGSVSLSEDNLFVRAIPSKVKVMEQEAIVLTYKLYSRVDVAGLERADFPEFKGFLSQEVDVADNQSGEVENYNGLNYRTWVLKQNVLYPQQSGAIVIEPAEVEVVVHVRNTSPRRSFFDDFFDSYEALRKVLKTKPVTIEVEAFPFGKPANFNSFSGRLNLTSSISCESLKADEAVTLKLVFTGNGNLKMLKTPEVKFPADFDVYDPKVSNQFKVDAKGMSGTKTIEYLVIPRYAGTFEIPAVQLSYYDLSSRSYKTLQSEPYMLNVERSQASENALVTGDYTMAKESLRVLGQDIRYIRTGDLNLKPQSRYLYTAPWFKWAYMLPFALFGLVIALYRRQIKANADVAAQKNRKANRVAVKRLKKASAYLKSADRPHFHEEVLKALWGYTSDKLNLPLSQLDKGTIDAQLERCRVDEDTRRDFMNLLETCEFEQYAPMAGGDTMDRVYQQAMDVINRMENSIKTPHAKK